MERNPAREKLKSEKVPGFHSNGPRRGYDDCPSYTWGVLMYPSQNRTILALIFVSQTFNAWAAEESFTIDQSNTFPSFEVGHLGFSTQSGRFNRTSGMVVMDEEKKSGKVDITIDANSIDTGIKQLDQVLREFDFLNVAHYPTLSFHSSKFRFSGDKLVAVDGTLTMLGVSRPISLTVTHYKCGIDVASSKYVCDVDAEASFKRSDHGMTTFIPMVSDEVKLKIKVKAARDR
jgi:polyisoprenoid-binding protein YceI